MKERPIIFSGPMVRAILDGRKTQTRRVVKLNCAGRVKETGSPRNWHLDDPDAVKACPHGQPGDRLWVRETWNGPFFFEDMPVPENLYDKSHCEYRADGKCATQYIDADDNIRDGWKPSIHMPRWASRITLEISDVRVERLQDISEQDAIAEGIETMHRYSGDPPRPTGKMLGLAKYPGESEYWEPLIYAYEALWDSINSKRGHPWDSNPWVWVIEFKRI